MTFTCTTTNSNIAAAWRYTAVPSTAIAQSPIVTWDFAQKLNSNTGSTSSVDITFHPSGDIIITGVYQGSLTLGATTLVSATTAFDAFIARVTPTGTFVWAVKLNATGSAAMSEQSVSCDAAGNIYFSSSLRDGSCSPAGVATRTSTYDAIVVTKLNSSGTFLWSAQSTSTGTLAAFGRIATDPSTGDSYVVGRNSAFGTLTFVSTFPSKFAQSSGFIAKINTSGAWVSQTESFGGQNTLFTSVVLDSAGDLIIFGYGGEFAIFGSLPQLTADGLLIIKYNSSLVAQWITPAVGGNDNIAERESIISRDNNNNIYIGGPYSNGFTFAGIPAFPGGGNRLFIAKFNSGGTPLWGAFSSTGTFGSAGASPAGDVYAHFTAAGVSDITLGTATVPAPNGQHCVVKFDTNGASQWVLQNGTLPVSSVVSVEKVIANGTGNSYATGSTFETSVTYSTTPPTVLTRVGGSSMGLLTKTIEMLGIPAIRRVAGATYTQVLTDSSIIFSAACTITLISPAAATGRTLYVKNIAAVAVSSAAANVIPLGSSTPGTSILAATAGKWAMLQSDGVNWRVVMGN